MLRNILTGNQETQQTQQPVIQTQQPVIQTQQLTPQQQYDLQQANAANMAQQAQIQQAQQGVSGNPALMQLSKLDIDINVITNRLDKALMSNDFSDYIVNVNGVPTVAADKIEADKYARSRLEEKRAVILAEVQERGSKSQYVINKKALIMNNYLANATKNIPQNLQEAFRKNFDTNVSSVNFLDDQILSKSYSEIDEIINQFYSILGKNIYSDLTGFNGNTPIDPVSLQASNNLTRPDNILAQGFNNQPESKKMFDEIFVPMIQNKGRTVYDKLIERQNIVKQIYGESNYALGQRRK
jgi:hypothetical protein